MRGLEHKFWHYPFVWVKHLVKGPAVFGLGLVFLIFGLIVSKVKDSFWIMAVGLPTVVLGVSLIFYGIYDLIGGLISPRHSKIDCPFCRR